MPKFLDKIMGNSVSLEEELINLRLTSKQMQRASKKCDKNEKEAVKKLKKVRMSMLGCNKLLAAACSLFIFAAFAYFFYTNIYAMCVYLYYLFYVY